MSNLLFRPQAGGGSGSGGTTGIITGDNSNFDNQLGDSVAYADAASDTPVNGVGGTPTTTVTRTTTSPLHGKGSKLITKDAADRQGEGESCTYDVDPKFRGKPCTYKFFYEASSNFAVGESSDVKIFFYNVSDPTTPLITPAFNYLDGSGEFKCSIQIPSSCEQIRVIKHIATTNALAWTLKIDDEDLDINEPVFLSADSDMELVTVTGSWTTNTTYTALRGKEGQFAYYDITIKTSGAPTAAALTLTLPDTIDISKMRPTSLADNLTPIDGTGAITDASTNNYRAVIRIDTSSSTTNVVKIGQVTAPGANNYITTDTNATTPFTFGNGDSINVKFRVPILGWTSGVSTIGQMYQNVPVSFEAIKNGGAITANVAIPSWTTVVEDTAGNFNATTGEFTISQPGNYSGSFEYNVTAGGTEFYHIRVNGLDSGWTKYANNSSYGIMSFQLKNLKVGDVVTVISSTNKTISSNIYTRWAMNRDLNPNAFHTINRSTTKYLASNLTSSTTDIASLRMSGTLIVGKRYRVFLTGNHSIGAASSTSELIAVHDGVNVARNFLTGTAAGIGMMNTTVGEFTATQTSLTFNWVEAGTATLNGNGTVTQSQVTIEELNNTVEGNF